MNILLLSRYGQLGASSRVRSYQYLPYLKEQGIHVKIAHLLGDDYLRNFYSGKRIKPSLILKAYLRRLGVLLQIRHFDLLWIEKELFPWLPVWGEVIFPRLKIPYVVDYDDAVFHRYDLHRKIIIRKLLGTKIDIVMRRATLVIVCNDYLAERAWQAGARQVEYLPSVVDLKRYIVKKKRSRSKTFNIGWMGSPTSTQYIPSILPAIKKVCEGGAARFILIGAGNLNLKGLPAEIHPWSEKNEVAELQKFDVGIMPLADRPEERGKCGYKLIQYMACGLPVVASPIGVNREIVENGINGFLAVSTSDWVSALHRLSEDSALRKKMGSAGRNKVANKYCVQVTAPRLLSLLQKAVAKYH
jgi:glycosyltransferase involved in cell wall biosynthesis